MTAIDTALLPDILGGVPQAVLVVSGDGRVRYANPAALATLGYDEEAQLLGRPSHEILHLQGAVGSPSCTPGCEIITSLRAGRPAGGDDEWFVRRDGTCFPASWWSSPIRLPNGRGAVYFFHDTTELRELERARRERDAARIRADESRAAQRRIVQGVAQVRRQTARDLHDGAQQRLVGLLIGLRLAREADDPAAAATLLDRCIADAQAAIDELRELAAGVHPSTLTVKGLPAALESLASRCPIPVTVTCDPGLSLPAAVESNAYFILAEALTNAVKHAQSSGVEISVQAGETLRLHVADDGIGGATTGTGGSGVVGMADRVAAFDGAFSIDSPPGAGTRIHIEIPLAAGPSSATGTPPDRPSDAPPRTVVVADDDPGFRRVATALLSARGFSVVAEAADGAGTVAAVRRERPAGLLLDLHLPDQDGLRVARALKGRPGTPRIVLTSTELVPWADGELAEAGVAGFVAKDRLFDADLTALFAPAARA
ncbi:response regulator [Actinomadura sp. NPDC049753]|uniref:response regulator n=1 Tax=Actinomadura sp. NPDC049753 TaxID=3154739 RepID=UPI003417B037